MDNLISVEKMCEILGYTPHTLRRMCREKKIPCYKIGRAYKFLIGEVEEWFESKKQRVVDKRSIKVIHKTKTA